MRPEILDTLAPDDPGAVANRRDLRFLNRFMGNWSWIARQARRHLQQGMRVLEVGAGEGDLGFYLRRNVPDLVQADYVGLDLWGRPKDWPSEWDWVQEDLLTTPFLPRPDILISNLLMHQFEDEVLEDLGRRIAHVPVWIINEPWRVGYAVWGLAAMRPFGLHPVSWHDGRVSIGAGFRGRELASLLGADGNGRRCRISADVRGGYRLLSWRE